MFHSAVRSDSSMSVNFPDRSEYRSFPGLRIMSEAKPIVSTASRRALRRPLGIATCILEAKLEYVDSVEKSGARRRPENELSRNRPREDSLCRARGPHERYHSWQSPGGSEKAVVTIRFEHSPLPSVLHHFAKRCAAEWIRVTQHLCATSSHFVATA